MSRHITGLAVIVTVLGWSAPARSATVYSADFEDPPFAKNTTLVGQQGWVGFSVPNLFNLSPDAAQIARGIHADGKQAVRVEGRDLEHQDFINQITGGYYDAIGSYRRPVNYDTHGSEIVRVSADVYVRGGHQTPSGDNFFSAGIATRTRLTDGDTAGTGEIAISSDGHVYAYSGNENVPTFLASAPVTLNAWHNLAVDVNPGTREVSFFLDGAGLGTFAFQSPLDPDNLSIDYTNVLTRGSLTTYAGPDSDSLKKQSFAAYYDNFSITSRPSAAAVPEPGCLVLLACGAAGLCLAGWSRKRSLGAESL